MHLLGLILWNFLFNISRTWCASLAFRLHQYTIQILFKHIVHIDVSARPSSSILLDNLLTTLLCELFPIPIHFVSILLFLCYKSGKTRSWIRVGCLSNSLQPIYWSKMEHCSYADSFRFKTATTRGVELHYMYFWLACRTKLFHGLSLKIYISARNGHAYRPFHICLQSHEAASHIIDLCITCSLVLFGGSRDSGD